VARLAEAYPGTAKELCALDYETPFQLVVATILSAQTTDVQVNLVTPALFAAYPDAPALAGANLADIEELIHSTGFFRAKSKSIVAMAAALVDRFGGEVPTAIGDLTTLPGVGRKTANVIRSVAFDLPGLPVDTHVLRLSRRLGLTEQTDPVRVERDLAALWPRRDWSDTSMRLIYHGRQVCTARAPRCAECIFAGWCPSARVRPPAARPAAR